MLAILAVVVVGQSVRFQTAPRSNISARVALGPDSTAVLDVDARGAAALAGLRSGDRLLGIGGEPVSKRWAAALARSEQSFWEPRGDTLNLRVGRGGQTLDVDVIVGLQDRRDAERFGLSDAAVYRVLRMLTTSAIVAFAVVGLFLFVRARARGYGASLGTALLAVAGAFGFSALASWDNSGREPGVAVIVLIVAAFAVFFGALPAIASALVRFPEGRFGPTWTRWTKSLTAAGVVAALGLAIAREALGLDAEAAAVLTGVVLMGIVALPAVGLAQKYREATGSVIRQRMKWALLPLGTLVIALALTFLSELIPVFDQDRAATGYLFGLATGGLATLALAAVPLGVVAGALGFRPWDADLWIARSAAVGVATLGLAAAFAGAAEALRVGLRASMGSGAEAVAAALAAVAALVVFNPVREWVTRRADADLHRARERLTERLPLLLAGRQVVATPGEVGRVAIATVRDALATDRAAVLDLDPDGWEVVATEGVEREAARTWAEATLDPARMPPCSEQVWEDPLFVLRVPLRSAEDELVGVLALGTHGRGRGYSTEERKALDAASRSLAEALRVAERRVEAEARLASRLAALVDRVAGPESGDGQAGEPAQPEATPPRP